MKDNNPSIIQVLVRASNILGCFNNDCHSLSIREIANHTGLSTGTVYRILLTLQSIGWIQQEPTTKKYQLGLGLFSLGKAVRSSEIITTISRPILESIQKECDETVLVYGRHGDCIITLDCIAGYQFVRATGFAGEILPFTSGGVLGLCLLAYMPENDILRIFPDIEDKKLANLKERIASVHALGYAAAPGEVSKDSLGVCAPIFDVNHNCIAELALYGPIYRVEEKLDTCIKAITDGAKLISSKLLL